MFSTANQVVVVGVAVQVAVLLEADVDKITGATVVKKFAIVEGAEFE